jgi:hypothetical protein
MQIINDAWGMIEVDGFKPFRDVIITPDNAIEWDWTVTSMHHRPGIGKIEVQDILDKYDLDYLILTRGRSKVLQVQMDEISPLMIERDVTELVLETSLAIAEYNRLLLEGKKVAGLFHSTC